MFEKYGEFDSAGEINQKAEELFNAGDLEGIRALAAENGIPVEYGQMYCDGDMPILCDILTAAIGKLDMEEQDIVMAGVMEDWLRYIQTQCGESEAMAAAVRRKGKSLRECLANMFLWSLLNQKAIDKGILETTEKMIKDRKIDLKKQTGMEPRWLKYTKIGIMNMSTAYDLIREYYLGGE